MRASPHICGQQTSKAPLIWLLAQGTGAGHYCRCRHVARVLAKRTRGEIVIFWRSGTDVPEQSVRPMPNIPSLIAMAEDRRPGLVVGDGIMTTKALAAIRIAVDVPTCLVVDYLREDGLASPEEVTLVGIGCSKVLLACPAGWVRVPDRYANLSERFRQCLPCVSPEIRNHAHQGQGPANAFSGASMPIVVLAGHHKVEVDLVQTVLSICRRGGLMDRVCVLAKPGTDAHVLPQDVLRLAKFNLPPADYARTMATSLLVIGTAGMNLITECLALGKRAILVAKPTADQLANGRTAEKFGLRFLMNGICDISLDTLFSVLDSPRPRCVKYDCGEDIGEEMIRLLGTESRESK